MEHLYALGASQVALMVKNPPASARDLRDAGLIPGLMQDWVDPLEEGMATHSSILDWRIPWTEEVSRGSAGEYQADERAGVARLSWRVSG